MSHLATVIASIQIVQQTSAGCPLTPAAAQQLQSYAGFGHPALLKEAVSVTPQGLAVHADLAGLLDTAAQESLLTSAPTAFYTPVPIVQAIWSLLEHMGIAQLVRLRILEPSCGTGVFFRTMPAALRANAQLIGVEIEHVAAAICRTLCPDVTVHTAPFETIPFPDASFDLVISNIPFSDVMVHDPTTPAIYRRTTHDYFLYRAIQLVRPGGIVAVLTSYGTMDKRTSHVRRWVAQQAVLLGALRLPSGTFSETGTSAGADLLLFQKRMQPTEPLDATTHWQAHARRFASLPDETLTTLAHGIAARPRWVESCACSLPAATLNGDHYAVVHSDSLMPRSEHTLSLYWHLHPTHVLGTLAIEPYHHSLVVCPTDMRPIHEQLLAQMDMFPADLLQAPYPDPPPEPFPSMLPVAAPLDARSTALIALAAHMRSLFECQRDSDDTDLLEMERAVGEARYDQFVAQFGVLHSPENSTLLRKRPELSFLRALETPVGAGDQPTIQVAKSRLLTALPLRHTPRVIGTLPPEAALYHALAEQGRVDLARIAELTGVSQAAVREALQDQIFREADLETERYTLAAHYLSGNLGTKLDAARACASIDPTFARNVAALEAALPPPLAWHAITVQLGSPWLPPTVIDDFIRSLFPRWHGDPVVYLAVRARWEIPQAARSAGLSQGERTTWGTRSHPPLRLLEATLNGRTPDGNDAQECALIHERQLAFRQAFSDWVWRDESRCAALCTIYNTRFNRMRATVWDGSYLHLPGLNTACLWHDDLEPHQKANVAMILATPSVLLADPVGAGKSYAMTAGIAELLRLKLATRACLIVPNRLVPQWMELIERLYPHLRVLGLTAERMRTSCREEWLHRIVSERWELVVMPYTVATSIGLGPQARLHYRRYQLSRMHRFLTFQPHDETARPPRTMRALIKHTKQLQVKIAAQTNALQQRHSAQLTWEQLQFDVIAVDEIHHFRRLESATQMQDLAGVPSGGSQRAADLHMKLWLQRQDGGRIILATGTPILNTMAEAHVMQRYLHEELLEDLGLELFDAWAQTFAAATVAVEIRPDGAGFRLQRRLRHWKNVPELLQIWQQNMIAHGSETITMVRPQLVSGRPIIELIPETAQSRAYLQQLAARSERIHHGDVDLQEDNMLMIAVDGRLAALDLRLVCGGDATGETKMERCALRVATLYHRFHRERATQLIFCDSSTPADHSRTTAPYDGHTPTRHIPGFVYTELRAALIARGVAAEAIAFAHDYASDTQLDALHRAMNSGALRVLIASTAKMGAGVNIQSRLLAVHHLDVPYYPSDLIQRDGRALRPGNMWIEVYVYRYIAVGTFDAIAYQRLETKARYLRLVLAGAGADRTMDDVDAQTLSYAEIKALASGNTRMLEQVQLTVERRHLEMLRRAWREQRQQWQWQRQRALQRRQHEAALQEAIQRAAQERQTWPDPHASWPVPLAPLYRSIRTTCVNAQPAPDETDRKTIPVAQAGSFTLEATIPRRSAARLSIRYQQHMLAQEAISIRSLTMFTKGLQEVLNQLPANQCMLAQQQAETQAELDEVTRLLAAPWALEERYRSVVRTFYALNEALGIPNASDDGHLGERDTDDYRML